MNRIQASSSYEMTISNYEDVIMSRKKARQFAAEMKFSLLDQTRIVTAVSELARNMVVHAKTGKFYISKIRNTQTHGLQFIFQDKGPGIENIEDALREGFSSSGSLGLGLSGAKKLSDEFKIESQPGKGTKVTITKWIP